MHQLENNYLRIKAREYGAELTSIFDKKNNIEHLWQADPAFWEWHAPVLFPVVGRCLNDSITIEGKVYNMEKHGFARKSDFKLLELSESSIVFSLKPNEQIAALYPYKFEFLIKYHLNANSLVVSYEVVNQDDKPIYFQLGGHPAFAVPFKGHENYEDYYLEFEELEDVKRHYINDEGFFNGDTATVLSENKVLDLKKNMFRDDALIFKDLKSRKVAIKSKVNHHALVVDFKGFNYLGLWAKVGAPYVCIEPWLGCADTAGKSVDYKDKEGVVTLETGKIFGVSFTVSVS